MALRKGLGACSLSGMVGLLLSKGCPHPRSCSGCDSRAPNQLGGGQVHQSTWVPGHHLTPGHCCQQVSPLQHHPAALAAPHQPLPPPSPPLSSLSGGHSLQQIVFCRLVSGRGERCSCVSISHSTEQSRPAHTGAPPTAQRIGARAGAEQTIKLN